MGSPGMNPVTCIVCAGTEVELQADYRAEHTAFSGMKRAHCASCGMVFAHPMPSDEVLDRYNASYFASAHGGRAQGPVANAFFSGIARLRSSHVEQYVDHRSIGVRTVLEYGPGPGYFARNWIERHTETIYLACETDSSCHGSLTALGVRLVSPQEHVAELVDLIVMSHVLEHVSKPEEFLLSATSRLRSGGALFIEVPCQDWLHKPVDEPHILFFDKQPIRLLLQNAGFGDIEVSYHGKRIADLRALSPYERKWQEVRTKLLSLGLVGPLGRKQPGMEALADPIERAVMAPFNAHRESSEPAWWLRAMATKI
jgi:hypothetical protein